MAMHSRLQFVPDPAAPSINPAKRNLKPDRSQGKLPEDLVEMRGESRFLPEMSSAPDDRSGVRIFPPLIYLGGLFLGFLLHWRLPLPIVPAALVGPLRLLGAFCLVAGLALTIWAVATFRRVGTTRHP